MSIDREERPSSTLVSVAQVARHLGLRVETVKRLIGLRLLQVHQDLESGVTFVVRDSMHRAARWLSEMPDLMAEQRTVGDEAAAEAMGRLLTEEARRWSRPELRSRCSMTTERLQRAMPGDPDIGFALVDQRRGSVIAQFTDVETALRYALTLVGDFDPPWSERALDQVALVRFVPGQHATITILAEGSAILDVEVPDEFTAAERDEYRSIRLHHLADQDMDLSPAYAPLLRDLKDRLGHDRVNTVLWHPERFLPSEMTYPLDAAEARRVMIALGVAEADLTMPMGASDHGYYARDVVRAAHHSLFPGKFKRRR